MELKRTLKFCAAHRLYEYIGACTRLHGHNYRVEVSISGDTLDHNGMIVDFKEIKRRLQGWLDEHWDHRTILNESDPWVEILRPYMADLVVMPANPTAEHMARYLMDTFLELEPLLESVAVWETDDCCAIQHK